MSSSFKDKLSAILSRASYVQERLNDPSGLDHKEFVDLSKEFSDLGPVTDEIRTLLRLYQELSDTEEIVSSFAGVVSGDEKELKDMAEAEYHDLKKKIADQEHNVKLMLLPKDIDDEKNAILEIRAGAGGDEAGLFAADLFRMYSLYASVHGWKFEVLEFSESGIGSIAKASASISGKGVYARLKFESGVHRVQRVPETEASGRIHTSTATVAILPEVEDIDMQIDDNDLKIETCRASGAGGQHVNKTDSAVRIVHLPTNIVVTMQDERSQHKNKLKAMKILRAKIYEMEKSKKDSERAQNRKTQVGTGDRSERIRTYNFPQGRVSDHRINLTLYKIDRIMDGTELDDVISKLIEADQVERMMGD